MVEPAYRPEEPTLGDVPAGLSPELFTEGAHHLARATQADVAGIRPHLALRDQTGQLVEGSLDELHPVEGHPHHLRVTLITATGSVLLIASGYAVYRALRLARRRRSA